MAGGRGSQKLEGRGGSDGGDSGSSTGELEAVERRRKKKANEFRLGVPFPVASGEMGFWPSGLNRASLLKDLGSDRLVFSVTVGRAKVAL
jgi:hypothetical protein